MTNSLLIIDNYDSFTFNLVHAFESLDCKVTVLRNDCFDLSQISNYDAIVLSPGPGVPKEAGLLLDVIKTYASTKKILGICLGHQAIAEAFGASLLNLEKVYHGIATPINILNKEESIFYNLPTSFEVGRYHSWVVDPTNLPECLQITAAAETNEVMAISHKIYNLKGVQFHPESILTPNGNTIFSNWLKY